MRRIVSVIIMGVLVLGFCACTTKSTENKRPDVIDQPFEDEFGNTINPLWNTAEINNWDITFENLHIDTVLNDNKYNYYPADGAVFVIATMEVTNKADETRTLLPMVPMGGIEVRLYPSVHGEYLEYEAENVMGYYYNAIGQSFEAGATEKMYIVFHVPEDMAQSDVDWRIIFKKKDMTGKRQEAIYFG